LLQLLSISPSSRYSAGSGVGLFARAEGPASPVPVSQGCDSAFGGYVRPWTAG